MDFAQFLAPFDRDRFLAEIYGKTPLHIPSNGAGGDLRAGLTSPDKAMAMLDNGAKWRSGGIQMVMDSRPVSADHYSVVREDAQGAVQRPDRALVEAMMALGATLVADGLEDIDTHLRTVCAMLGREFAAKAGVNLYASHEGVQAFASHCDPHEVFAVQCSGAKRWRVYEGRASNPVRTTLGDLDQAAIEHAKGAVALDIVMKPGDMLYIPRGFFHDAIAIGGPSLHLTFGVQPLYGAAILDLLRDLALDDEDMRAYIPPADGTEIGEHLEKLAKVLTRLMGSAAFLEDLGVRQRTLATPIAGPDLFEGQHGSEIYVRTDVPCRVEQPLSGSVIVIGKDREDAGLLSDAARWILSQRVFTPAQFFARFCHHPREELVELLQKLVRYQAVQIAQR